MATETGRGAPTVRGYLVELLDYPRWVIEREVDFTHCRSRGHYNAFLPQCAECRFGEACRWLDRHRTPSTGQASLDDLVEALESAVAYLGSREHLAGHPSPDTRDWLRKAQRFLSSHRG